MQKMVSTISSFGDLSKLQYHLTKLHYFPEKMRGTRGGGTMRGTLEGRNNDQRWKNIYHPASKGVIKLRNHPKVVMLKLEKNPFSQSSLRNL